MLFNEARKQIPEKKQLEVGAPEFKIAQNHFWSMFKSDSPVSLGKQLEAKAVGTSRSNVTVWSRAVVADAKALSGGNDAEGTDPYSRRAQAFKNVVDAYVIYLTAISKSPHLSANHISEASDQMIKYGSNGGPGSMTVGLDYQGLPFYYDSYVSTIDFIASLAFQDHESCSEGKFDSLAMKRIKPVFSVLMPDGREDFVSPLIFGKTAQKAITQHAIDLRSKLWEDKRRADQETREQQAALRAKKKVKKTTTATEIFRQIDQATPSKPPKKTAASTPVWLREPPKAPTTRSSSSATPKTPDAQPASTAEEILKRFEVSNPRTSALKRNTYA
jgi:hypothetical protein